MSPVRSGTTPPRTIGRLAWPWRLLHAVVIGNFVAEIAYATYQVFFVVTGGTSGPLFGAAGTLPFELMVTRRLYAIESWIAIAGLAVYLALTELLPRLWQAGSTEAPP